MQQIENLTLLESSATTQIEAPNETAAMLTVPPATKQCLAEVAHDARNMVTALGLYCDLLEEPGVLAPPYRHYGGDLKQLATASRSLVERLIVLEGQQSATTAPGADTALTNHSHLEGAAPRVIATSTRYWEAVHSTQVRNLARELQSNRNLMAALAGPSVSLTVEDEGGAYPVSLTSEDLTRVLVNLVKNAVEAMPKGGKLHFKLRECPTPPEEGIWLLLNVEDTGSGFDEATLDRIFEPGFTSHKQAPGSSGDWRNEHRGLGLSITRSIIEAAGGKLRAANRDPNGACLQIELPVRSS